MSDQDFDIMKEFAYLFKSVQPQKLPFLEDGLDDATLVLLATSLVDELLKIALVAGFHKNAVSRRRIEDVFTGHGPLATFSAKISVSSLLGLTTANVRHDLTILRKIRNDFAHSHQQLHLNDFANCLSLKLISKLNIADKSENRTRFKHSCAAIIGQLATATLIRNAQYRFISKNAEGVTREYETMLKEASEIDDAPHE
jgi:DNA-binding MltR family transcriptional regulator